MIFDKGKMKHCSDNTFYRRLDCINKMTFSNEDEKRDKNEGDEVGWVHWVLARNGFICSRKCRSLTVGQIISTTKEIQVFCCPRNIIC